MIERIAIVKQKKEDCKKVYKKVFYRFTIETWPDNMNKIELLYKWRAKLVKFKFFTKSFADFVKMLKADYNLIVLGIQK